MRVPALALVAVVLAFACTNHRTDFVYLRLATPEPESQQIAEPPVEGFRGEPLPVSYRYTHAGAELLVELGRERFVPSLSIESSTPIRVDAGECATVLPRSSTEVAVTWSYWRPPADSCISVGDAVTLTIQFSTNSQHLELTGHVSRGGTFRYLDAL